MGRLRRALSMGRNGGCGGCPPAKPCRSAIAKFHNMEILLSRDHLSDGRAGQNLSMRKHFPRTSRADVLAVFF